jgi:Leucine-rich repeat (LRR) protein
MFLQYPKIFSKLGHPQEQGVAVCYSTNGRSSNLHRKLSNLRRNSNEEETEMEFECPSSQLLALPPEIGKLSWIRRINLEANNLTSLPQEFFELRNLTSINLSHNRFSQIPEEV